MIEKNMSMSDKTLPIGKVIKYYNLATNENVILKVEKSIALCEGCYFNGTERHCPDEWACGKYARTDGQTIIFRIQGDNMDINQIEQDLLTNKNIVENLSYDDLLKEKHYLACRMEDIENKKRDLCKQRALLQSISSKITKRIKELNKLDNDKKAQENKDFKRVLLLEKIQDVLKELKIDPAKINEELAKLKQCEPTELKQC